jgi:co-chaperonin GroES (HSP10)
MVVMSKKEKTIKDVVMITNNIFVYVDLPGTTTKSGIEVGADVARELNQIIYGTILVVGPDVVDFKVGDEIMLPPHGGTMVALGKEIYHVFRETSLFGKYK